MVAVVVIAVVAGVAAYVLVRDNHSTPVAASAAVSQYRALQGSIPPAGAPAPGVYTYATSGWECAGIGSLCLRRSLPHRASVIVTRRGDMLTIQVDLSQQHLEAQRYRITPRGRLLVWQRTRISILGVTQDDAHTLSPETTLSLPAVLHAGERWTQTFNDEAIPVTTTNTVTRRQTVAVSGHAIPVWLVTSDSRTGGAHPGTEHDTDWHSTQLGLDVEFTISRRIGGNFPYRLQASGRLLSLRPAR